MNLFLTGATGFVGKHLLYYILKTTDYMVTIPVREKKGISSEERYDKEFMKSVLFTDCDMTRVQMINKDIENIDTTDISGISCFIHCAAAVQFNRSLELLIKDNVQPVKKLYKLCEKIKFIYVSTCYVHPKTLKEPGKPERIEEGLEREQFICDYAYTKYLAEQFLYQQNSEIDIVRLSCVGAPLEDLQPMRGPAHLSILETGYRKSLSDVWFPDNFQFSVVPLDIVCKHLIKIVQISHNGLLIQQFSAPQDSNTYNISALELGKPIFKKNNVTYWKDISYEIFVILMSLMYFMVPTLLKKLLDVNYIISTVASNIVFEPTIELPKISKEDYLNRTHQYVKRLVDENPTIRDPWLEYFYSIFLFLKASLVKMIFALYP